MAMARTLTHDNPTRDTEATLNILAEQLEVTALVRVRSRFPNGLPERATLDRRTSVSDLDLGADLEHLRRGEAVEA
jgi:hypothetical protein